MMTCTRHWRPMRICRKRMLKPSCQDLADKSINTMIQFVPLLHLLPLNHQLQPPIFMLASSRAAMFFLWLPPDLSPDATATPNSGKLGSLSRIFFHALTRLQSRNFIPLGSILSVSGTSPLVHGILGCCLSQFFGFGSALAWCSRHLLPTVTSWLASLSSWMRSRATKELSRCGLASLPMNLGLDVSVCFSQHVEELHTQG